jgi:hypothetical protein
MEGKCSCAWNIIFHRANAVYSLARNPWFIMKDARRAFRLSISRQLTMDDMPEFRTYSTATLIFVYLQLAASESFLRTLHLLTQMSTLDSESLNDWEESLSLVICTKDVLPDQFKVRIVQRVNMLRSQMTRGMILE